MIEAEQINNETKIQKEDSSMKNNNIINKKLLTNDGFFAFHKNVIGVSTNLKNEEVKPLLDSYTESVKNFGDYISNFDERESVSVLSTVTKRRDEIFLKLRSCVRSMCKSPRDNVKEMGSEIWKDIKDLYSSNDYDRDSKTSAVELTLKNVKELVGEKFSDLYSGSDLEIWMDRLENLEEEFIRVSKVRVDERQNREQDSNSELRKVCMDKFYLLRNYTQYLSQVKNDPDCTEFVRNVELLADTRRSLYTSRKKRREKDSGQGDAQENEKKGVDGVA